MEQESFTKHLSCSPCLFNCSLESLFNKIVNEEEIQFFTKNENLRKKFKIFVLDFRGEIDIPTFQRAVKNVIESSIVHYSQPEDQKKLEEKLLESIEYCHIRNIEELEHTISAIFYILHEKKSEFEVLFFPLIFLRLKESTSRNPVYHSQSSSINPNTLKG